MALGLRIITLGTGSRESAGNTPTDALGAAAKIRSFTYDGDYAGHDWHDFDITSIGGLAK